MVLIFARKDTSEAACILLIAVYSLNPETQNSLTKMSIEIKPIKELFVINTIANSDEHNNILSAIGSNSFPSNDS